MHWSYEDVRALPVEVYGVVVEMLSEQTKVQD
jgi:hypothetical protein